MIIVLNIGNTNTTAGLFSAETLSARLTRPTIRIPDETIAYSIIKEVLDTAGVSPSAVHGSAISSVVPAATTIWVSAIRKFAANEPVVISAGLPLGIEIRYENPSSLGSDRLCASVAAFRQLGGPAIAIDFGTATTYNLIDNAGNFIGGAIAPGFSTAAKALHRDTAQLPDIGFIPPQHFPGRNTRECIEAGIFYLAIDATAGMIARLKSFLGPATPVIATGGLAPLIRPHVPAINEIDEFLVLKGARIIYDRCSINGKRKMENGK